MCSLAGPDHFLTFNSLLYRLSRSFPSIYLFFQLSILNSHTSPSHHWILHPLYCGSKFTESVSAWKRTVPRSIRLRHISPWPRTCSPGPRIAGTPMHPTIPHHHIITKLWLLSLPPSWQSRSLSPAYASSCEAI